jgi:DNA-binding SARP family transcriptional activator/ActR/RegA family two-component response regulator
MTNGCPPRYRLSLLGNFSLSGPDGSVDLSSKKLAGLLAYLALTSPAPQSRDKLVDLLWGSHFEVQARQNFRQALFRLRRALGQDAVSSDGDEISLAPGVVGCDATKLEALTRDGSHASLAQAVALYRGRLLADVAIPEPAWADWVAVEQRRLEGLALDALVKLGDIELASGHSDKALETASRALAINNLREDAHRTMLEALAAAGRRAEALKHYQDLVALLKRELNVEPDAATKSVVAKLRGAPPPGGSSPAKETPESAHAQPDPPAYGKLKVLIVDDHTLIREALHTVLRQLKRETVIFEASNSHQAVRIVEEHHDLSLILLDINLPDRDGFSILDELRERYPTIAIIILSGSIDQDQVKRAFRLGALGFIPKTTERDVMLNAIELVLSGGLYIPSEALGAEGRRLPGMGA